MTQPWKPQAIILATDLGKGSAILTRTGIELARLTGSELRVIHVFRYLAHHRYMVSVAWMMDKIRQDVRARLAAVRRRAKRADCNVQTSVIDDENPARIILKEAEGLDRAIVVVGTHARDPIERFFLGSVAEEILRTTRFPVVTVGPHVRIAPHEKNQHILFATDLTERSLAAIPLLPILMTHANELTVLHVTESPIPTDAETYMDTVKERMLLYLPEHVVQKSVHWKLLHKVHFVEAVVEEARVEKADLLVIGLHRSGEFNAHLPLKAGFQIITSAPCAVLSVCS